MTHLLAEYSFENLLFLTLMLQFEEFVIENKLVLDIPSNRIMSRRINLPSIVPKATIFTLNIGHRSSSRPYSVYSVDSNSARILPGFKDQDHELDDIDELDEDDALDDDDAIDDLVEPEDGDQDDDIEIICADDEDHEHDVLEEPVTASPSFSEMIPTISTDLRPAIGNKDSVTTGSRSTPSVDSEGKHTVDMLKDRSLKRGKHHTVHWDEAVDASKSIGTRHSDVNERTLTHTVTPTVIQISNEVNDLNAKLVLVFCTIFKKYIARDKAELEINTASDIRQRLTTHFEYAQLHNGRIKDFDDCYQALRAAALDCILNLNDSLSRFRFYQKQLQMSME